MKKEELMIGDYVCDDVRTTRRCNNGNRRTTMTNKQLIEVLKALPEDADVKLCYGEEFYDFNSVKLLGKRTIVLMDEYLLY